MTSEISQDAVLKQFVVLTIKEINLPWVDWSLDFTNSSLVMFIALFISILLLTLSIRSNSLVPNRMQMGGELLHRFISSMVVNVTSSKNESLLAFILTVFTFTASCNLMGLIPGSFTVTSHVSITFLLGALVVALVTVVGICNHKLEFGRVFLPKGVPLWLAPLISTVEFTAYMFRSVSLSLRLTANMIAGHVMLKVIAALGSDLAGTAFVVLPLIFLAALTGFEIFVAILQAYVFSILSCVYLSDAFKQH